MPLNTLLWRELCASDTSVSTPPAGQLERGAYIGEDVAELKPGIGKYEDIEVLRVLYPRGWTPRNPFPEI